MRLIHGPYRALPFDILGDRQVLRIVVTVIRIFMLGVVGNRHTGRFRFTRNGRTAAFGCDQKQDEVLGR